MQDAADGSLMGARLAMSVSAAGRNPCVTAGTARIFKAHHSRREGYGPDSAATRRLPICVRYFAMCWSSMMGYGLRTSDAASFPSCTSCFGVYYFGSVITVSGRQARCKFLQDGGRNLPIASLAAAVTRLHAASQGIRAADLEGE